MSPVFAETAVSQINKKLSKAPKTAKILIIGVLFAIASNMVFNSVQRKIEPIDAWSEETVLVIRRRAKTDEFWISVKETLISLDPEFGEALKKVEQKTTVSPFDLARKMLPEPTELLIIKKANAENSGLQYDFALVTKAVGPGIENLPAVLAAARDFASWYLPKKRLAKLQDGATITANFADPSDIQIKNGSYRGYEIKFIREPGLPFEFAYAQNSGWLLFATSKLALEQLLGRDEQKIDFNSFKRNCASPNKEIEVFFNPKLFKVEQTLNPMALGGPVRALVPLFDSKTTKVVADGVVLSWKRCGF
ncbi:hypothetical protein HYT45_04290 [Candidatus Uhrbacteria bacterium]|nr:hypothetical protein [Candidatus Uhrbacteria bacterium]